MKDEIGTFQFGIEVAAPFGTALIPARLMCEHRAKIRHDFMSDVSFPWHVRQPQPPTFAKRAVECRWLAMVSPSEFRETYLKLAAEYEQLAKGTEKT